MSEGTDTVSALAALQAELAACRRELATCRDQLKRVSGLGAEEADKRQCLLATLEAAQIGLWEGEIRGLALSEQWSPRFREIFGVAPDAEVSQTLFLKCIHPDDRGWVERAVLEAVSGANHGKYRAEYRIIRPSDGTVRWVRAWGQAFLTREGKIDRLIGTVLDVTIAKQLEQESLLASEQLARGQVAALRDTLDALAMESAPNRLVEHVLKTIAGQLGAHSCSVWQRDEQTGMANFEFSYEDDRFVTKADPALARIRLTLPEEDFWPWQKVFRTGKPGLMADIRAMRSFPWRERLISLGVVTILIVPMSVAGRVVAAIGVRFTSQREFRTDEVELAQALANQAMLAMRLTQLYEQSRESAVLAERNRLARDIHDTLAQGFTGVIVQLEAARGAAGKDDLPALLQRVEQASDLARTSLGEARRSVHALRPGSLTEQTLFTALDGLLRSMSAGTSLNAEFRVDGEPRPLPAAREDVLLRITQEALTNTLKHARAGAFRAVLGFGATEVQLRITDDGRGFAPGDETDGFGLIGMRERVVQIGGQFAVRTAPGAGVEIVVTLGDAREGKTQASHAPA